VRRPYRFAGTWTVEAPSPAVQAVLLDLERYPEWWPQIRAVASLGPDDARVLCRSALPYTLDLVLHAVRRDSALLEVGMDGDLVGTASWRLTDLGGATRLEFAQEVTVGGWLAAASVLAGRLLRWNHGRMMAGCIEGLKGRLMTRDTP
jgi:Polyketide cyclase / dehydrase and lipid transport